MFVIERQDIGVIDINSTCRSSREQYICGWFEPALGFRRDVVDLFGDVVDHLTYHCRFLFCNFWRQFTACVLDQEQRVCHPRFQFRQDCSRHAAGPFLQTFQIAQVEGDTAFAGLLQPG